MRRGDVIGIARQAIANDFGVDFCAACLCVLIFFQNDNACAFTHNKTVAVLVIGAACGFGTVVETHVQRACLREARNAQWVDRAFCAASQHDVGVIVADHTRGITNGVRAGGTGGHHGVIGAFQAIFNADLTRDQVDEPAMHKMRANAAGAFFREQQCFAFNAGQTANAGSDGAASA